MEPNHPRQAAVLGSAPGGLEELSKLRGVEEVLAINQAGCRYQGPLTAWGSVHGDEMQTWIEDREDQGLTIPASCFYDSGKPSHPSMTWYGPPRWPGSSALYVVQWGLLVARYDRLVLCGVHLNGDRRVEASGQIIQAPNNYQMYRDGWRTARKHLDGRVTSMGGWTRELLGPPDWRIE